MDTLTQIENLLSAINATLDHHEAKLGPSCYACGRRRCLLHKEPTC